MELDIPGDTPGQAEPDLLWAVTSAAGFPKLIALMHKCADEFSAWFQTYALSNQTWDRLVADPTVMLVELQSILAEAAPSFGISVPTPSFKVENNKLLVVLDYAEYDFSLHSATTH